MQTHYEKLVEKIGVSAANEYMRSIRAKVKKPGLANLSKKKRTDVAKKGWETRKRNAETIPI